MMVGRLYVEAAVDLLTWGAVQVPDLEAETRRLDKGISESGDANVVDLTIGRLNIQGAITLDIICWHEVPVLVCMRLYPGAGEELCKSVIV